MAMLPSTVARGVLKPEARGQQLWNSLLDVLFPPHCAGCQADGSLRCETCQAGLKWVQPPLCLKCGEPNVPGQLCSKCREHPLQIEFIRSVVIFQGTLRHAIHRFKYQRLAGLARPFGDLLANFWVEHDLAVDRIMPVPLHPARQRDRGYNQAALLARRLAQRVGVSWSENGLRRTRATAVQMELDAAERRVNVAGAFECVEADLRGRRVVVIDDVCTTGATLDACAAALFQGGVASVFGLTLARTP
jgi:ComF family protein